MMRYICVEYRGRGTVGAAGREHEKVMDEEQRVWVARNRARDVRRTSRRKGAHSGRTT